MRPLCVFYCPDQIVYENFAESTAEEGFHRYFIFKDKSITQKNNLLPNDSFAVLDYDLHDINFIARMIVAYSDAIYTDYFIVLKEYKNIDEWINKVRNKSFYFDENFIYFSKEKVVIDGYNLTYEKIEVDYDYYEYLSQAMNGIPVPKKYFVEAIKELIPQNAKFIYDKSCSEMGNEYKIIFKSNDSSNNQYEVFYESRTNFKKNSFLFTKEVLDSNFMVLKCDDGMNFYIQ